MKRVFMLIGCVWLTAKGAQGGTTASKIAEELNNTSIRLSGAVRKQDPFGLPVSANDMAVAAAEVPKAPDPQRPTLLDAVSDLKVDGVNGGLGEFMVGPRTVRVGDVLTLSHKGVRFDARVVEVRPFAVQWEDVATGIKATIKLSIIPQ